MRLLALGDSWREKVRPLTDETVEFDYTFVQNCCVEDVELQTLTMFSVIDGTSPINSSVNASAAIEYPVCI